MSTLTALDNLILDAYRQRGQELLKGEPVLTPLIANAFAEPSTHPSGNMKKVKVPVPEMPADTDIATFTRGTDVAKADRDATSFVEVELTEDICDDYPLYADEKAFMYADMVAFFDLKIMPRWQTIIRKIERAGFAKHTSMYNVIGTAGDPPDSIADLDAMTLQADTQLMPDGTRYYICDPVAYSDMRKVSEIITFSNYGATDPIRGGQVPEVLGFFPKKSKYLKNSTAGWHTVGGWSADDGANGIEVNQADHAIGDTSVALDGLTASQASGYIKLGDRFTVAGDTTIYTVTANAATDSSGEATVSYMPAAVAAWAENADVTVLESSGLYVANLFITPGALLYGASVPPIMQGETGVRFMDIPGIGQFKFQIFWDQRARCEVFRTEIMYGWGVGQQDNSIVVLG